MSQSSGRSILLCLLILYFFGVCGIQAEMNYSYNKIVTCYVASWAAYRPNAGQFQLSDLQPQFCTHLIYAFAGLNETTWKIQSLDPWGDTEKDGIGNYMKMTSLRKQYPTLKISIAIGGWNEGSSKYSTLAADSKRRKTFIASVIDFLRLYNFDGLDLDWEYPAARGGASYDKENFAVLIKELKNALDRHNFILTSAISAEKSTINAAYDIPEISKYLNYIHVMAYDYHGAWEKKVLPNTPLHSSNDDLSVEGTLNFLLELGAPPEKLVLGLAMYGRTYDMNSQLTENQSPIGMPCKEKGFSGPYTSMDSIMGYNEICETLKDGNWTTGWDKSSQTPYMSKGYHAITYDNAKSIEKKVKYAIEMNLAGVMVWSIDTDDFRGRCGTKYILMKTINNALSQSQEHGSLDKKPSSSRGSLYNTNVLLILCATATFLSLIHL